jgi:hypothetical protein
LQSGKSQLGVWQVLLQDVGVDGGDDDVVAAVDLRREEDRKLFLSRLSLISELS